MSMWTPFAKMGRMDLGGQLVVSTAPQDSAISQLGIPSNTHACLHQETLTKIFMAANS